MSRLFTSISADWLATLSAIALAWTGLLPSVGW